MTPRTVLAYDQLDRALTGLTRDDPVRVLRGTHASTGATLRDMHWELELGVVLSGRMERQAAEWNAELRAGMVWVCGSWEPHGYRISSAPCDVAVWVVSPVYLSRLSIDVCGDMRLYRPFGAGQGALVQPGGDALAETLAIARDAGVTHTDRAHAALSLQRMLLLLATRDSSAPVRAPRDDPFSRLVPSLSLALESKEFVGIVQAAGACGLGRNAFSALFRRATGLSFADFALRRRLRGVAHELSQGHAPIKAIAYDWGFTDPSHLNRTFHAHFGQTPGEYRIAAQRTRTRMGTDGSNKSGAWPEH